MLLYKSRGKYALQTPKQTPSASGVIRTQSAASRHRPVAARSDALVLSRSHCDAARSATFRRNDSYSWQWGVTGRLIPLSLKKKMTALFIYREHISRNQEALENSHSHWQESTRPAVRRVGLALLTATATALATVGRCRCVRAPGRKHLLYVCIAYNSCYGNYSRSNLRTMECTYAEILRDPSRRKNTQYICKIQEKIETFKRKGSSKI